MRFKPNTRIHVYRPGVPDYDEGRDVEVLIETRTRARRSLRRDSLIDGDGVIHTIDGTVVVDPTSKVREGDIIVFTDVLARRYHVQAIDEPVLVSGRVQRKVMTIALERTRRNPFPAGNP